MKTLEEMIEVMKAAQSGAQIEYKHHKDSIWKTISDNKLLTWSWENCDYRVEKDDGIRYAYIYNDNSAMISKNKSAQREKDSSVKLKINKCNLLYMVAAGSFYYGFRNLSAAEFYKINQSNNNPIEIYNIIEEL